MSAPQTDTFRERVLAACKSFTTFVAPDGMLAGGYLTAEDIADAVVPLVAQAQRDADVAALLAYGERVTRDVPGTVAERLRVWRAADVLEATPLVSSKDYWEPAMAENGARFIPAGFVDSGELVETTDTEHWCPQNQAWSMCPGPCPDGTPHEPSRTRTSRSRRWVRSPAESGANDG